MRYPMNPAGENAAESTDAVPGRGPRGHHKGHKAHATLRGAGRRHGGPFGGFGPGGFGPGGFGQGGEMPFGGPGPFGRGRGRGRRGDVRNAILALLSEGPRNGYQVIADIAERTDGLWRPSAGSVYPALGLLEDEGLIEPVELEGKKAFQLTEAGTAYVAEHAEELTNPWERVAKPQEGFLDVRAEVGQLAMAVRQVVMAGDKAQVERARTVLADARKAIYQILAEG